MLFKLSADSDVRERTVNKHWSNYKASAAFAYAAARLQVSETTCLLDAIVTGEATFRKHKGLLSRWFALTRFAAQDILGNCKEEEFGKSA
jgi:hypothetical protein